MTATTHETHSRPSIRRYLGWSTDHKVIGIQYLVTTFAFFLLGGAMAVLVRTELFNPGSDLVNGPSRR